MLTDTLGMAVWRQTRLAEDLFRRAYSLTAFRLRRVLLLESQIHSARTVGIVGFAPFKSEGSSVNIDLTIKLFGDKPSEIAV
jgi:hypothetical protein